MVRKSSKKTKIWWENPGVIPAAMADKTVLSMKAASGTGDVRVMHSVPETLVAVGHYKGDDALKVAIRNSKEFMQRANEVAQTGEKPANYLGINVLVELESRQEMKVIDARGKVFQNVVFLPYKSNCTNRYDCVLKISWD